MNNQFACVTDIYLELADKSVDETEAAGGGLIAGLGLTGLFKAPTGFISRRYPTHHEY